MAWTRAAGWLAEAWLAERERWALWLPVLFGAGIGLYFALPVEPEGWQAAVPVLVLAAALAAFRKRLAPRFLLVAALALALGFCVAFLRTWAVAAPLLQQEIGPVRIEALLETVEEGESRLRLTLRPTAIEGMPQTALPARIRVTARSLPDGALPGAALILRATLMPPPTAAMPGAYDFGRDAWFRGLGAVGYTLGAPQVAEAAAADGWSLWWSRLRADLGQRVRSLLPGDTGAVTEALLAGQRAAISERMNQAFRDSGLAHLLSISGLHVSLVAGLLFVGLRSFLALLPGIALRWPIKKWAAFAAAVALPFYLFLVGASVPTQRATLMALVVLLAVMLDRRAISLRLVAWAALAVLLLAPEAMLGPSFQMSFAAVVCLIAAYERIGARLHVRERGPLGRLWLYAAGVTATSLIAGLATTPFGAYHFGRLQLYGLAANLAAVPLTAFWVMPWCLVTYLLLPFGLEGLAIVPLGWGVAALNGVAVEVASWPGAALLLPALPLWGLLAIALGGLWLCLNQGIWRWAGLVLVLAGALGPWSHRPPDILVSADARVLGVLAPDGQLWLNTRRAGRFASDAWLRRLGEREAQVWTRARADAGPWLLCDTLGCLYRSERGDAALVFDAAALAEDCWAADVLVSLVPIRDACPPERPQLDRFDLWWRGGHAIWLGPEVTIRSVDAARGRRPWNPTRRPGESVALPDGWESEEPQ